MNNRFIVVITSYNNEKWVSQNIESVLSQTHQNFRIAYYDACSTDNTYKLAKEYSDKDSRITVTTTPERQIKTWFCERLVEFEDIRDNDIICVLDGDDFLANEEVLNYLNEVYNKTNCWMTYGGMIVWDGVNTKEPYPQNTESPYEVKRDKTYRKDLWRYSHFRTFRGFLWERIKKESWKSVYDNNYITLEDLITMYDCMEMCPADKIFRIDQTVYILNYSTANGGSRGWEENKINNIGQIYESEIRNRKPYSELSIVTPILAGGLGNQMFEIATAASLAKDNDALIIINPSEHILPNQGRNVNAYLDNVFSRIATDNSPPFKTVVNNEHIYYTPIIYRPNLRIGGHNQSFKYFDHNKEYIQNLFGPTEEVLKHIDAKYGLEKTSKVTIVQVRRGDYIRFPDHLPLLPIDYYLAAAKQALPEEIWICSDDIDWCKENLPFNCPVKYLKDEDYIRMYLMSLCKNVIISNSSFGWWGCYLNKNSNKKIYVPSVWFGKALIDDGFKMDDLILSDWIKI